MAVLNTEQYRKMRNISINQLSYKSKVAKSYLTELEGDKYKNPGLQVICKLCKALKITPNELIDMNLWKWWQ